MPNENASKPMTPERPVLLTDRAQCRDCYRCVRVCPVKAIRMQNDQAEVVAERCILCGRCIQECPQHARSFRNDTHRAKRLIEEARQTPGAKVAVSVAPSFAALFLDWQRLRLPSALRKLGFDYVGETAVGAAHVASELRQFVESHSGNNAIRSPYICTACPAVVRYIERYEPKQVERLLPIVSPMIAHARHIHEKLGPKVSVVFLGPCLAKKAEAERPELEGDVQCVLTFTELMEWLAEEGIEFASCEESDFDEKPSGVARIFPIEGGCLRTAGWRTDILDRDLVTASGIDDVRSILAEPPVRNGPRVVEPLLCPQGCINGPAIPAELRDVARRDSILQYASKEVGLEEKEHHTDLATAFHHVKDNMDDHFTDDQVRDILDMIGKANEEDRLDCGACGYPTCWDKAVAVLRGMAEPTMCIPRMRHLAEQRTDRIIETSPNGIVILDSHLNILHMNHAFRRFFTCTESLCGRPISILMDPEPFERTLAGATTSGKDEDEIIEMTVEHDRYGLVTHQLHYRLPEENQLVGIFVNITGSRNSQKKLDRVRAETIHQARDLLQHQLDMAETIARALGESTARGESLVEKLLALAEEK